MAISNQDRLSKAMELLRTGLAPYVTREFESAHADKALEHAQRHPR